MNAISILPKYTAWKFWQTCILFSRLFDPVLFQVAPKAARQEHVLVLRTHAVAIESHEDIAEVKVAEHHELGEVGEVDLFPFLHFLGQGCGQDLDQAVDVLARQIEQGLHFPESYVLG